MHDMKPTVVFCMVAALAVAASAVPFSIDVVEMEIASCRITDEAHTDVEVPVPSELPQHAFVLLSCTRQKTEKDFSVKYYGDPHGNTN